MAKKQEYNEMARASICQERVVCHVLKGYGVDGELIVRLRDDFSLEVGDMMWVEIDALPVPVFVRSVKGQGVHKAVVVFDDFQSEELAAELIGHKLYADSSVVVSPLLSDDYEDQESEWGYLVGFTFEDATSGLKGVVSDYIDNVMNPLLVVDILSTEHYIPIDDSLIVKVHKKRRHIVMKLAAGLLDLGNVVAVEDES